MTKKIGLGFVALVAVAAGVVGLSAFEAHVINVTAKIENALAVNTEAITFGTVFPQEQLEKELSVRLSDSFIDETRVDDVNYIIRQKPKCAVTSDNGTVLVGPTWTGHVVAVPGTTETTIDCEADKPTNLPTEAQYGVLPSLCEYISKHPDGTPEPSNDGSLNSFHQPFEVVNGEVVWTDVAGRLAKSEDDFDDLWTIDLAVPCFGGNCAQDWASFVEGVNPGADPDDYVQSIENEHKIFGCNLWIEVNGVSESDLGGNNSGVLSLENKTGDPDWNEIADQTFGTLGYNLSGSTFDYVLTAQGLNPSTSYALIYAPDPWPQATGTGENTQIASGSTDGSGNLALAGSIDLGYDMPHPNDANFPAGAKIWVVLSSDHDGQQMIGWNPAAYLFEHELIMYDDTDI